MPDADLSDFGEEDEDRDPDYADMGPEDPDNDEEP